ncbi:hypothetical protein [Nitrospira lenta]|uniref:hypothetical protein n=1 Tax=Nitrospira lenta TaxID=1436998 RepID=UPI001FE85360|nr:hypothetical protein [Nitrospira lenta]
MRQVGPAGDRQGRLERERKLLPNVDDVTSPIEYQKYVILEITQEMMDAVGGPSQGTVGPTMR